MLPVTLFISMSIYLCPYWYCQELYIDMIDHCMKEPIISPITQKELQTSNSCIGYSSMWKILKDYNQMIFNINLYSRQEKKINLRMAKEALLTAD